MPNHNEPTTDTAHAKAVTTQNYLENGFQLLHLHLRREEGLTDDELRKYATHPPAINARAIPRRPQQKFRWAIPQRDHTVGKIRLQVTQSSSETKVGKLDVANGARNRLLSMC